MKEVQVISNEIIAYYYEYQQTIKESIKEIATINKDANPNTLWEIIKGTVRNETI